VDITKLKERVRQAPNRDTYQAAKVIEKITNDLYDIMEAQGLNQADLAAKLGTSEAWISKLLQGNHNMTIKTVVTIAHTLGYQFNPEMMPQKTHRPNYVASDDSVIQLAGTELGTYGKAA